MPGKHGNSNIGATKWPEGLKTEMQKDELTKSLKRDIIRVEGEKNLLRRDFDFYKRHANSMLQRERDLNAKIRTVLDCTKCGESAGEGQPWKWWTDRLWQEVGTRIKSFLNVETENLGRLMEGQLFYDLMYIGKFNFNLIYSMMVLEKIIWDGLLAAKWTNA